MRFLNEMIDAVLELERKNESQIHLFHVNGSWSAIERSAYHLSQVVPCNVITLIPNDKSKTAYGQIVLASVSDAQLDDVRMIYPATYCDEDYLVVNLKL